jgi:hypothetical protein
MERTKLSPLVASQLPEFVREDYPTFVAFVEAYYEYLDNLPGNQLHTYRDLDNTLDDFLYMFKNEIAAGGFDRVTGDPRFILPKAKDAFVSKGSPASYNLLFRLLYGKSVELNYPGTQMLRTSDGRWNQEISLFAKIDYGNAEDIVGKLVDITSGNRILRVLVDRKETLIGEIDRIVQIGGEYQVFSTAPINSDTLTVSNPSNIRVGQGVSGDGIATGTKVVGIIGTTVYISLKTTSSINANLKFINEIYEFFLDKKFFGEVNVGDKIKYLDSFQATILPITQKLKITQKGKNFRVGQVFELQSGGGTPALMKVTQVDKTDKDSGIKYAEIIKFGLGYESNFGLSILSGNSVTANSGAVATSSSTISKPSTYSSPTTGSVSSSKISLTVTGTGTNFGQAGNAQIGDELWTTDSTPLLIGVIKSIESTTSLTLASYPSDYDNPYDGSSYSGTYTFRNSRGVGTLYSPGGLQSYTIQLGIQDRTLGFSEQGYINKANYADSLTVGTGTALVGYWDGSYAGEISREYSLSYKNAQTDSNEPAVVSISLGALARYPGYFTTNNGFLDDSIFIQDSKYYQTFSYVIKIDERLNDYKSIIKSLIHPAGMALFSEFNITNQFDLSISLESLVKALGIGLKDAFGLTDSNIIDFSKVLFDSIDTPSDSNLVTSFLKALADTSIGTLDDSATKLIGKSLTDNYSGTIDTTYTFNISKALSDTYSGAIDATSFAVSKALADGDIGTLTDSTSILTTKGAFTDSISEPQDALVLLTGKLLADTDIGTLSDSATLLTTKSLTDSATPLEAISSFDITTVYADSQSLDDTTALLTTKYVTDSSVGTFSFSGEIWTNPYFAQDYNVQGSSYGVGLSATITN